MFDLNIPLQLQIVGNPRRFKSILIGRDQERFLIIKTPDCEFPDLFQKRTEIVIRYVFQGSIYGFKTSVILSLGSPINAIFIKFPAKIEDYNLRSYKRFECRLPIRLESPLQNNGRQLILRGTTIDLSQGGCKLTISQAELKWIDEPLQISAPIELHIAIPGLKDEIRCNGSVRNLSQDQEGMTIGIQFAELNPRSKTELQKFLAIYQQ